MYLYKYTTYDLFFLLHFIPSSCFERLKTIHFLFCFCSSHFFKILLLLFLLQTKGKEEKRDYYQLICCSQAKMSADMGSERVCYVHCNFCNTILVVSVPYNSTFTIATVRCGHCASLLSVNLGALLQPLHLQDIQLQKQQALTVDSVLRDVGSSSSKCKRVCPLQAEHDQPKMPAIRPPEKRQRVPSAYNRFIKEEIQRIKANNPEISHREAFSTAAKNWAHFPHIHFGLTKQAKNMDHAAAAGDTTHKSLRFY